ncbi:hypothetical protein DPMN_081968 [Dreissena polymorpha]|uniref:Uncharacterized protein n=1 Tax=Dreissena polymorpha TaxID=45954 RepID=A0A9D3Y615_DREPO|nr:hypothetical protein DPMN_081968 [Dreissena polymorpha]
MSKTRAGLLRHIRGHANSGNYNCCGKAFQDAYNLRRLQRTKGPQCHVCVQSDWSFADKYLLVAREKSAKKRDW